MGKAHIGRERRYSLKNQDWYNSGNQVTEEPMKEEAEVHGKGTKRSERESRMKTVETVS